MPIPILIVLFLSPFLISVMIVPLIRQIALSKGFLDLPSARRKIHKLAVPRLGGVAIFFALFIISFIFACIFQDAPINFKAFAQILAIASAIFLVGAYDDLKGLNAPQKFLALFVGVTIFWLLGYRLEHIYFPWIGDFQIPRWLSFVLTTFGIVGFINAMNWVDGIDELASGTGIITASSLAAMQLHFNNPTSALVAITLSGATLGFFYHNTHPARIFMGDSGSMLIGFVLGGISLTYFNAAKDQSFWLPLLVLGVPIMELLTTIVRRLTVQHSLFQADREHIHHKLLTAGLTSQKVSHLLNSITLLFSIASIFLLKRDFHFNFVVVLLGYLLLTIGYIFLTRIYYAQISKPIWARRNPH